MRMSAAVFIRSDRSWRLPEGLVLFLFFAWGAAAAGLELFDPPALPEQRLQYSLFLLAMLLFAASGFGWLGLPMEMLAFGFLLQRAVLEWYASLTLPRLPPARPLVFASLLILTMFQAATHGLCASSALRLALFRASPSARSRYQKELSRAAIYALFGFAAVFYFT